MPYAENHVGWQETDTSLDAARHVSGHVARLRAKVEAAYKASAHGMTADETAALLGETVLSIRPRITELKQDEILVDTGIRRKNSSGRSAAVMAYAQPQMVMDL